MKRGILAAILFFVIYFMLNTMAYMLMGRPITEGVYLSGVAAIGGFFGVLCGYMIGKNDDSDSDLYS